MLIKLAHQGFPPFSQTTAVCQVVKVWERAAIDVGGSALLLKLIKGGTFLYMWSECFFGLLEEAGPAVAAVAVAVRPVAVSAFNAVSSRDMHWSSESY